MESKNIKIIEKSVIVGIAIVISIIISNFFNLSKFFAGTAILTVINLNDTKTRQQAYHRVIATGCGGIIAALTAYLGFQQNMYIYLIGLALVCIITEFLAKIPATVGCVVFTYIILNIDPQSNPIIYVEQRVLATLVGAIIISIIITFYNKILKKPKENIETLKLRPIEDHIQRGIIPGIAVILGFFIIGYLNKYISSKYITNYTLYYCALASIVVFNIDMKELLYKSKERILSTIFGGLIAFLFLYFNLNSNIWIGIGIVLIITLIEIIIGISGTLGGVVFLFIMVNMKKEMTPFKYYIDRVIGTAIGLILIIFVSYFVIVFRRKIFSKNK